VTDLSQAQVDALLKQPDPYGTGFEKGFVPGTGPGAQAHVPDQDYTAPHERNVRVGPLWISTCRCPQCGQGFAHEGLLRDDEPDPPCWRCEVSVGVPLDPEEAGAMAEFRWRYDRFLAAIAIGSGESEKEMRHRFITACDSGMVYAPRLLAALERRYGNQVEAGVQAILNGAAGVK
jgi:hypothetical protein